MDLSDSELLAQAAGLSQKGRDLWSELRATSEKRNAVWLELLQRGQSKKSIAIASGVSFSEVHKVAKRAAARDV